MAHALSLGEISDAEELRKPINDLCLALKLEGSIRLLSEFSGGFTDTRVFLAEVRASPADPGPYRIVFKTGPSRLLHDEARRFEAFISHARAHAAFAKLLAPERTIEILSRDESLGAIAYDYAPAPLAMNECSSLSTLAEQCVWGEEPIEKVRDVITAVVGALASLYAVSKSEFSYRIARYYLERWAPDFQISVETAIHVPGSYLLTLDRFQPDYFLREPLSNETDLRRAAESPPGTQKPELRMKRLVPAHRDGNRVFLHAPHADDLCIEVAIDALEAGEKKAVAKASHLDIWAPTGISRYEFYRRRIAAAFPDFDPESATFSIGTDSFHNPLQYLSQPLMQLAAKGIETNTGPAHGDLHPGNVLVVGTTPIIIDYGLCEENLPFGVDVGRLFGGLVRGPFAKLALCELADILSGTLGLKTHQARPDGPVDRSRQLLEILSDGAGRILGPSHSVLWPYHLYGVGWIGLKWSHGTTNEYRASFLLSAIALTKVLGLPNSPGPALDKGNKQQNALSVGKEHAIKPEGPAEILVIVAEFSGRGDFDPTARIYGSLADHVHEVIPKLGRVERVAESVVSRKDAVALASQYKASMIVWGFYDSLGVSPRYDVTRDSLVMKSALIQLDQATRHALGERFEPYVTHDLTEEISYLSLVAIGEMCMLNLSYDAGISVFERALSLIQDPERAAKLGAGKAYAGLSALLATTHRNKEALAAIAQARQLDPSNFLYELQELTFQVGEGVTPMAEAFNKLRDVLIRQIPVAGDDADALRKAVATLESVKNPTDLANLLRSMPRPDTRVRAAKGPRTGGRDVVFHLQKGVQLFNKGRLRSALKELKKALRINPQSADALVTRARVSAALGEIDSARRDLSRAERIEPREGSIYTLRGAVCWFSDGNAAGTIAEYTKAYDLGYPKWPPDLDRSEALVSLGREEEVMGELKRVVIDPRAPEIFVARSMCYQRRGDLSGALTEVNQAMSFWESSQETEQGGHIIRNWMYMRRGEIRWAMGDRQGAVADLEEAISAAGEFVLLQKNTRARLEALKADEVTSVLHSGIGSPPP
jgi:tetratricopeptide (TPR) repeat protein